MKWGKESNEAQFLPLLGKLVLVVADVEGAAGEVVVLKSTLDELPPAWARSGQQLISALRKCYDRDNFQTMCGDMEKLLPQRNLLVHGEWMFQGPQSDTAWVMNRKSRKGDGPLRDFDMAVVRTDDVEKLITAYERVFQGLSGYIGEAMGLDKAWD